MQEVFQCSAEPGKHTAHSLDGGWGRVQVMAENKRHVCVFQHLNQTGRSWVWWDFAAR